MDEEYTPETLWSYEDRIKGLRRAMLCIDEAGANPESEQYHLLALTALEQAQRYIALAALKQSYALANS